MKKAWISKIKEIRKIKNLSLEEASKAINVPVAFLKNLEKEKFKKLPPAVYTKFHIKKYFDLLEVNADECLKDYESYISKKKKKNEDKDTKKREALKSKNLNNYLLVSFGSLFAVGLFLFFIFSNPSTEITSSDINSEELLLENFDLSSDQEAKIYESLPEKLIQEDSEEKYSNFTPLEDIPLKLNLEILGESWIVLEDKNERLLYELMQTGSYELRGVPPFSFKVGYAPAVKIFISDKELNFKKFINRSSNFASFYTINGYDVEKN